MKKINSVVPIAALAMVAGLSSPLAAFAAPSGGLDATPKTLESSTPLDGSGIEYQEMSVPYTLDSTAGKWTDKDGGTHDNGKFLVTVPTGITYTGIDAGHVDLSGTYDVTVAGVIRAGDTVTATQTPNGLRSTVNDSADSGLQESDRNIGNLVADFTQGKKVWTAAEVSVMQDSDEGQAQVIGTTAQDTYRFHGDVRNANDFGGEVSYTFKCSKPSL